MEFETSYTLGVLSVDKWAETAISPSELKDLGDRQQLEVAQIKGNLAKSLYHFGGIVGLATNLPKLITNEFNSKRGRV